MTTSGDHHAAVFGLLWGDEGKGKVVDLLCPAFDLVVRHNGGANAGHTVCIGDEKFALHLLPSGVLHKHALGVIGPGVVVSADSLLKEIDDLSVRGIEVSGQLRISDRAHLVLAHHLIEDRLSEAAACKAGRIGTTARGIGPCYADKMKRSTAVRFSDLLNEDALADRVRGMVAMRSAMFQAAYGEDGGLDADAVLAEIDRARTRLGPMICNTTALLHDAMAAGQPILFEGANGLLLDVDHGTYPYVTSSSTGPYGIGSGAGVMPSRLTARIGAAKSYATRVGSGPFVSELKNETGDRIRQAGNEFGTTTGRPRRCGWFDAVACRYSAQIAGATDVALMHLDTLSGFDRVGICVAYRCDGKTLTSFPTDVRVLERSEPVIEYVPGWHENLRSMRRFDELPGATRSFIDRIERELGVPVTIASVGAERSQTLVRGQLKDWVKLPVPSPA